MTLKNIYYRGYLKSCNYNCCYCPFHKKMSKKDQSSDKNALQHFCQKIATLGNDLNVMLTPYGEALIHDYYHKSIAKLCNFDNIKHVGCQTNLSFSIPDFISNISKNRNKIRLWCSYHPSQVTLDTFLAQCFLLYENNISFSVGAVGDPKYLPLFHQLKNRLPDSIYFWLNAIEGFKKPYTETEIREFTDIDPCFYYELTTFKTNSNMCIGGQKSVLIKANGDAFACHLNPQKLGNIYTNIPLKTEISCKSKDCHCYLAYSNRKDFYYQKMLGMFRIPQKQKSIFFDIDGTLTDSTGKIPLTHINAIRTISKTHQIFVATSLPFHFAKKVCFPIWDHISGGVFAEGSDIRIFPEKYHKIIPLNENYKDLLKKNIIHKTYQMHGLLYKITLRGNANIKHSAFHIIYENGITSITAKEATKLNGILKICQHLNFFEPFVTVVGNSKNDIPMLQYFTNSIAVLGAELDAIQVAKRVCSIVDII